MVIKLVAMLLTPTLPTFGQKLTKLLIVRHILARFFSLRINSAKLNVGNVFLLDQIYSVIIVSWGSTLVSYTSLKRKPRPSML